MLDVMSMYVKNVTIAPGLPYLTFLALKDFVENISKTIDEGNYSIGMFLDLSIDLIR